MNNIKNLLLTPVFTLLLKSLSGATDSYPIETIKKNELARAQAELEHDVGLYRLATLNVSCAAAGYYQPPSYTLTPEEKQIMLNSVVRTRAFYKGKPNLFNSFYLGYTGSQMVKEAFWIKIHSNKTFANHIAAIFITDALTWGLLNEWQSLPNSRIKANETILHNLISDFQKVDRVTDKLKTVLLDIVQNIHNNEDLEKFVDLILDLSDGEIKYILQNAVNFINLLPPSITLSDLILFDFTSLEERGWDIHKSTQFLEKFMETKDKVLQQEKKFFMQNMHEEAEKFKGYFEAMLQPVTPCPILLTPDNKHYFSEQLENVPYDGTVMALEYQFFHPIFSSSRGNVVPPPLSLYLTSSLKHPSLAQFLDPLDPEAMIKRAEDYQTLVLLLHRLYCEKDYGDELSPFEKKRYWEEAKNLGALTAYYNYGVFIAKEEQEQSLGYFEFAADRGFALALSNYVSALHKLDQNPRSIDSYTKMAALFKVLEIDHIESRNSPAVEEPDLEQLFSRVTFTPSPQSIKLRDCLTAIMDNSKVFGDIEIHFRNAYHLKKLMEQIPSIKATNIYFIYNPHVLDGNEFIALSGRLAKSKFIHVMSNQPLKVSGGILHLAYPIILPSGSDFNELIAINKELISASSLSSAKGFQIAAMLDSFDPVKVEKRTKEAQTLVAERKKDRRDHPEKYPRKLADIAPHRLIFANGPVQMVQNDYLESKSGIIYIAPSLSKLRELKAELLPFNTGKYAYLIDPSNSLTGIYSQEDPFLRSGFEITTDHTLVSAGKINIPSYNIYINTKGDYWHFADLNACYASVNASHIYFINIYSYPKKPEGLPLLMWERVKNFYNL